MKDVVQIGIKIYRNADGSPKYSVPILVKATPELKAREAKLIGEAKKITAHYLKQYIDILDEIEKERAERAKHDAERKQIIQRIKAAL